MYISIEDLFLGILGILGGVALVYIIITLAKFGKLITSINDVLSSNRKNIDKLCESLPVVSQNIIEISDNVKDVSEVVTETTAEVIVAKDNITSNIGTIKDILNILVSIFTKK